MPTPHADLIACVQWGLENESMMELMPFYEEHFSKFMHGPHIPGNWTGALFSGLSDLKTGCAETNFDSQFAIHDSGLRILCTKGSEEDVSWTIS
jgi:hypothetical protein